MDRIKAKFQIEDCFKITGRGHVLVGRIKSGVIISGNHVQFEHEGQVISKKVLGVEFFRTQFSERRDNIGILVSNISKIKGLKQSTLRGIISDIVE